MAATNFEPTAGPVELIRPPNSDRPATTDEWEVLATYQAAPPDVVNTTAWYVGANVLADVDAGVVGELRLRSSLGNVLTPAVSVSGHARYYLGYQGVVDATQLIHLEGRNPSGAGGGVRVIKAGMVVLQFPPFNTGGPPSTPPSITAGQSFTVTVGSANGTLVGNVVATDDVAVTGFSITAGNTGGAFSINNLGQIQVANSGALSAGVYSLTVQAVDGSGNQDSETVTVTASAVPTITYMWEGRPPYVEPDPTAAAGSPGKVLADQLGLTSRVNVTSAAQWNSAFQSQPPGTQIYSTANIVGDGTSQTCTVSGSDAPIGGGGSAVDGTAANPKIATCAPGTWIDGGQTAGQQNLNSRAIQIRGLRYVGLYGVNARRATFVAKFDQCNGTAGSPKIVRYCTFAEAGHSLLHLGGYFAKDGAGNVGESNYFDIRYNELRDAGLGSNQFGEAFYVGYGSGNLYTTSMCHDIEFVANYIHDCPAESVDLKPGTYSTSVRHNLITDCGDSLPRTGGAANEGFPGSIQCMPASDSIYPGGYSSMPGGYVADVEVLANRIFRCSSAAAKFPQGQVLVAHRGITVAGNAFEDCTVGTAPQILIYIEDGQSFGNNGTIEVHNNTSKDPRALLSTFIGGGSNPTELANATNNTNASNNVGTSSQTGVDLVVGGGDFAAGDGTGNEGSQFLPATGGALDVTGADTSAHWSEDFGGEPVAAPVNPGCRQL